VLRAALTSLLAAACTFSGSAGGPSGSDDAGPDSPVPCEPEGDLSCGEDQLQVCEGGSLTITECPAGCIAEPQPHCGTFTAPNGVETGSSETILETGESDWIFVTDTGEILRDGDVFRAAGEGVDGATGIAFTLLDQGGEVPALGVFQLAELRVAADTELRGRGEAALAIAATGPITVAGVIEARGGGGACTAGGPAAGDRCAGPGGFVGGATADDAEGPEGSVGLAGEGEDSTGESGGGGGGHGTDGGDGGDAQNVEGGEAGTSRGDETLIPLIGGSGGGGGGTEQDNACGVGEPPYPGGPGGGGGGALQLVSAHSISFETGASCGINAGGGGGAGGGCRAGGGGGGSGGAILLVAPRIDLAEGCALAANGGGGGGSHAPLGGGDGQDGRLGTDAASGGQAFGAPGGAGATDGPGVGALANNSEAGGGGGGTGRIRLLVLPERLTLAGPTSPPASTGELVVQ
jgi:hypothetical protein